MFIIKEFIKQYVCHICKTIYMYINIYFSLQSLYSLYICGQIDGQNESKNLKDTKMLNVVITLVK